MGGRYRGVIFGLLISNCGGDLHTRSSNSHRNLKKFRAEDSAMWNLATDTPDTKLGGFHCCAVIFSNTMTEVWKGLASVIVSLLVCTFSRWPMKWGTFSSSCIYLVTKNTYNVLVYVIYRSPTRPNKVHTVAFFYTKQEECLLPCEWTRIHTHALGNKITRWQCYKFCGVSSSFARHHRECVSKPHNSISAKKKEKEKEDVHTSTTVKTGFALL